MYGRIRNRRGWLPLVVLLILAGGGLAFASIPGSDGTISACYANKEGTVRIIDSSATCGSKETPISWNQQGPAGPAGPAGPQGPAGPGTTVLEAAALETVSITPSDTPGETWAERGGPSLTVDVPTGGRLVQFLANAEISLRSCGNAGATVREVPDPGAPLSVAELGSSGRIVEDFFNVYSGGSETLGAWTVRRMSEGTHTFTMRYRLQGTEPCTAKFRNRHIYAMVLG